MNEKRYKVYIQTSTGHRLYVWITSTYSDSLVSSYDFEREFGQGGSTFTAQQAADFMTCELPRDARFRLEAI